ncbi:DUF2029 domain-containing protein [Candidatus Microgenomates bacterium]|nr:MAG: DUF2029 domain-containing protein [Candidatus Microgenomates bacterium]
MKKISITSILLFSLVIPFIMTYRLSPGETSYWFFGLIFLGLLFYLILDLLKLKDIVYSKLKQIVLWFIIIAVVGGSFTSTIIVRHQTAPIYGVHDIILQQEAAIRYLIHGKNPYSQTYFGTPLEEWHYSDTEINPALYHFVMEPFYLLFTLPFYFISNHTIGFFDARIPLLFLFFSILIIGHLLIKDKEKKQLFLIFFTFNPAMLGYTLEGRSDIFMFAFLFFGFFLLQKNKYFLAGVPIGLAFVIKQSVWPILPLYFLFLYFKTNNLIKTLKVISPFVITTAVIITPFFLWNQKAFLDSTVFYLSGAAPHSYPISGYGFGRILYEFGFIKSLTNYYPFQIWQIIICLPTLILLAIFLKRKPSVYNLIISYGIFLFVFWYFSRYFNNSHLGYLSTLFITAYFWPSVEQ